MVNRVQNNSIINAIDKKSNIVSQRIDKSIEFNKVLDSYLSKNEIKISAHAADRMKERNIKLNENDLNNIKTAMDSIRSKGGRDALILYKDVAYITSIRNSTIITAVDSKSLKENVFTNIDSALII